jgi:hypothetical protein
MPRRSPRAQNFFDNVVGNALVSAVLVMIGGPATIWAAISGWTGLALMLGSASIAVAVVGLVAAYTSPKEADSQPVVKSLPQPTVRRTPRPMKLSPDEIRGRQGHDHLARSIVRAAARVHPAVDPRLDQISELHAQAFAIVEQMFKKNCRTAFNAEAINKSADVMIAAIEGWLSKNAVHQLTQVTTAKNWAAERNFRAGKNLLEEEANPNIYFDCLAGHMVLRACMDALSTFEHQLRRASAPTEHE